VNIDRVQDDLGVDVDAESVGRVVGRGVLGRQARRC
jgi:hypothetical protein